MLSNRRPTREKRRLKTRSRKNMNAFWMIEDKARLSQNTIIFLMLSYLYQCLLGLCLFWVSYKTITWRERASLKNSKCHWFVGRIRSMIGLSVRFPVTVVFCNCRKMQRLPGLTETYRDLLRGRADFCCFALSRCFCFLPFLPFSSWFCVWDGPFSLIRRSVVCRSVGLSSFFVAWAIVYPALFCQNSFGKK